jgi:hypothetical protein
MKKLHPLKLIGKKIAGWISELERGGNIIDFAILYHDCTVSEFLKMVQDDFYFHQQSMLIPPKKQ